MTDGAESSGAAPTDVCAPADDRVRREWLRRVEAEYRSSAITQELTLALTRLGAPPALLHDGLRIADDEVVHAELSHLVFLEAGGEGGPRLAREGLGFPIREASLEQDVLRCALVVFCLGETVAVRLFTRLRSRCAVPVAREALDRVLRDEVRHRDFGWTLLAWLLDAQPGYTQGIQAMLPEALQGLRRSYGDRGDAAGGGAAARFDPARHAWGLMAQADYAEALRICIARDYRPRLAALGIDLPDQGPPRSGRPPTRCAHPPAVPAVARSLTGTAVWHGVAHCAGAEITR